MDIRSVDLNLLPVLDALLRHRSATVAARELNMSQSALSTALGRLRLLMGDELFVRTGRGLRPTTRAADLAAPVGEILERLRDEVLKNGHFEPAEAKREFRIAHSDVGAYVLWPRAVQTIRERAPGVRLALRTLTQADIGPALAEGHLDLAIGSYPSLPDSLFQQRLFERVYVALMADGHPLADAPLTVRAFARAPQVVVRGATRFQERIDELLAQAGTSRTDCVEVPSYLMIPPLLEQRVFLAVVPGQLADAFARHASLVSRPLPFSLSPSVIRMHWHRRVNEDAGNRWLRALMVEQFATTPARGAVCTSDDIQQAPRTPRTAARRRAVKPR